MNHIIHLKKLANLKNKKSVLKLKELEICLLHVMWLFSVPINSDVSMLLDPSEMYLFLGGGVGEGGGGGVY